MADPQGARCTSTSTSSTACSTLDPINPQQVRLENGKTWSRFFTDSYLQPIVLELWELKLLYRLTEQILPFRTGRPSCSSSSFTTTSTAGPRTPRRSTVSTSRSARSTQSTSSSPATERHRLNDYRLCLKQIDRVLRKRNPNAEPSEISKEIYNDLYNDDGPGPGDVPANRIDGWDYGAYSNPPLLPEHPEPPRRHGGVLAPQVRRERRRGGLGLPVREI